MHVQAPMSPWSITPVTSNTIDEAITFLSNARSDMFPTLGTQLNDDVARWIRSGYFLSAWKGEKLVGTIGYVPYDHRFSQLNLYDVNVVEVVRLYVLPDFRQCGLATAVFEELKEQARKQGIESFYLHTHPFLPGAITFWEKRGFAVVDVEDAPAWRTTHMHMLLDEVKE